MKIKYNEWQCLVCNKTALFTGKDVFSPQPYWFTIWAGGCSSTSERPSFNTVACSIACLAQTSRIIDDSITNHKHSIPDKKEIEATICDQCGKVVKIDTLNLVCGPSPLEDWTREKTSAGRKDFCSEICRKDNIIQPENSVFVDSKFNDPWNVKNLIKTIGSKDFMGTLKVSD